MRVTIKIDGHQAPEDRFDEMGARSVSFVRLRGVEMDRELTIKALRHIADRLEQNGRAS